MWLSQKNSRISRSSNSGWRTVTLKKARELLSVQADMGGGYNRNGARLILAEVQREHGQAAVDAFIREFDLEQVFGFKAGTQFTAP
jgi:hypothetical protein